MNGASANARDTAKMIAHLKRERLIKFHVLHPENPNIHDSRRVFPKLHFFGVFS
jgi:hypothetical protein